MIKFIQPIQNNLDLHWSQMYQRLWLHLCDVSNSNTMLFTSIYNNICEPCCSLIYETLPTWKTSNPWPPPSPPPGVWTRNLFEMWLFWENGSFTLPAFLVAFDSVVDIGDIDPVEDGPTQLQPCVHHHLLAETVLRHISHLFKKDAGSGKFTGGWGPQTYVICALYTAPAVMSCHGWNSYLSAHVIVQCG